MKKNVWQEFYKKRGRYYLQPHEKIGQIISRFKLYKVHSILDMGSGSGRHSVLLAKNGFKVVGIDFSKESLKLAKNWSKNEGVKVNFVHDNIHKKLKFRDSSFDAVIAIDSLHYDTRESLKFTLKETARILKDKGMIFLTLPTKSANKLVTHLVFTEEEILDFLKDFDVVDKFYDDKSFLCVLGVKKTFKTK